MKVSELIEASETPHKHILWVDDVRMPPANIEKSCDIARTYDEAISMLSKHMYTDLYLDHDLADVENKNGRREMTGYDVLIWIVQRKFDGEYVPKNFHILTQNPVGRDKFVGVINRYLRS